MTDRDSGVARPVVLLSGPPGAGKSTVARELVAQSEGLVALIEGDVFLSFLVKDGVGGGRPDFQTVMMSMVAAAVPFARSGRETIVDFPVPPSFLATAQRLVHAREIELDYVILRPSERVCAARAAARAEGQIADYGVLHDFYASFEAPGYPVIKDEEGDARETAARVRAGLDAKRFRVPAESVS